jgi:hypothetical protein
MDQLISVDAGWSAFAVRPQPGDARQAPMTGVPAGPALRGITASLVLWINCLLPPQPANPVER